MKNRILIYAMLLCFALIRQSPLTAQNQTPFVLKVELLFNNQALVLDKTLDLDSLTVTAFRFYLSNFQFFCKKQLVWAEPNSYHLLDVEEPSSLNLTFALPENVQFDSLQCHLGIDSLTSTEGAKGGDLDPTKGMYWAWQSGYINFKLEGKSRLCPTRKNEFKFHIGGFIGADYALQTIGFQLDRAEFLNSKPAYNNSKLEIQNSTLKNTEGGILSFDIAKFLALIDLKTTNHIMSPSPKAVDLAAKAAAVFSVSPLSK